MQEELGQDGRADVSKRCGGRRYQTGIAPGERSQQAEETKDQAAQSNKEKFFADDVAYYRQQAFPDTNVVEVADALHGGGEHYVTSAGSQYQHSDSDPEIKRAHAAPLRRARDLFRAAQ